jgi:hypothetical protein
MHERERTRRRDEPPAREAEPPPEHALLALQRTAGNRAVGALLARDPTAEAVPADAKKDAVPSGPHVVVPGIGAIPVESYSMAVQPRVPPAGRGREEAPKDDKKDKDELPGGEVFFSSVQGEHSTALYKWSLDGRPKDLVIVVPKGTSTMRITLKGALISSFNLGTGQPPMEGWAVTCTSMKFEISQPDG